MAIITVLRDQEALAATAAERVTSMIEASIAVRHAARVCLSGGRTPRRLYELLADSSRPWRGRIDWTRVHVCWSDERHVPPDHPESNFGMAHRALLAQVPLPAAQVHRMRGELPDAADAAREYEIELSEAGPRDPHGPQGSAPHSLCDVLLLGLGEDGHIASIFPESVLLKGSGASRVPPPPKASARLAEARRAREGGRLARAKAPHRAGVRGGDPADAGFAPQEERVAAVWAGHLNAWRITLTPSALLAARAIVVLVSGPGKAAALSAALDGPEDIKRWPAQLLRAAGDRVEWLIDSAAARRPAAPLS